jgi:general transcription factor IIIA
MKNESFVHYHHKVSFVDAYSDVNHKSDNDSFMVPIFDAYICRICAVLLESAYDFRRQCQKAEPLIQDYCLCCQLEDIPNNGDFLNMKTRVFVHNHKSITFAEGFSAVNNYSVENAAKHINSETNICKNCAIQLESAYAFQKMCRAAPEIMKSTQTTHTVKWELTKESSQTIAETFSGQRNLRSTTKKLAVVPESKEAETKHVCNDCDKSFDFLQNLRHHIESVHLKIFHCEKCPKKFALAYILKRHIDIDHLGKRRQCQKCSAEFKTYKARRKHFEIAHLKKKYTCEDCAKVFMDSTTLYKHKYNVHPKFLRTCGICSKKYKGISGLASHMKAQHKN